MYCLFGDELRLYYAGYDQPHDKVPSKEYCPAIGSALLPLDGFVSQDAAGQEGWLTTLPFTIEGNYLEVNMDGSARGWLKVEILDEGLQPLKGFTEADADRLRWQQHLPDRHVGRQTRSLRAQRTNGAPEVRGTVGEAVCVPTPITEGTESK